MTDEEIDIIARHYIEHGRTDAYGRPDVGSWEHIKANKPVALAEARRLARWAVHAVESLSRAPA